MSGVVIWRGEAGAVLEVELNGTYVEQYIGARRWDGTYHIFRWGPVSGVFGRLDGRGAFTLRGAVRLAMRWVQLEDAANPVVAKARAAVQELTA